MPRPLPAILAALLCLLVASPAAAEEPALAGGRLPTAGGIALVSVAREVGVGELLDEARAAGCDVTSLALTSGGRLVTYLPGAPAFVNASFPGSLAASSVLVIHCARPPLDVPDLPLLTPVTKDRALDEDFAPEDLTALPAEAVMPGGGTLYLREEAAAALREMLDAAGAEGHVLALRSAYRSYQEQVATYGYWVGLLGETEAARRSARPGHSEHQLGTVVDLTSPSAGWELLPELGEMPEGRWLARHAWRFGFVASYPAGAEEVTGYAYEPWHLRYIGRTHAEWLRASGLTLTEYLDNLWAEME